MVAAAGLRGTALVAAGDRVWASGSRTSRYVVFSVTKTAVAAAVLLLAEAGEIDLDAPAPNGAPAAIRRLLDHTGGIPDYGALPEYHEAVRRHPSRPWTDDELLERALARGPLFAPGAGWAYSNTGYLVLRRLLDEHGGLSTLLPRLGLAGARVAEEPDDLRAAVPAPSALLLDGVDDVRGRYHPRWVGHRTLVASVDDLLPFWSALPQAMTDAARAVPIGVAAPGFARPSYGIGVMMDPGSSLGLLVGHGGGGPGYAAAVFAAPAAGALAIVLTADEQFPAQTTALALLATAVRRRR